LPEKGIIHGSGKIAIRLNCRGFLRQQSAAAKRGSKARRHVRVGSWRIRLKARGILAGNVRARYGFCVARKFWAKTISAGILAG
jgi:hypothetical protein